MRFGNAPLVQVTAKASLREPRPLGIVTALQTTVAVGKRFRVVQDLEALDVPPGRSVPFVGEQQIQGIYFASPDHPNIVTVQSDLITARWIRRGEEGASLYPGFKAISHDLSFVARAMNLTPEMAATDVEGEETPIAVAQLSYVDLVVAPDLSMREFVAMYLKDGMVPVPPGKAPHIEDLNVGWSDGELDFRLIIGRRRIVPVVDEKPVEGVNAITAYTMEWIAGTKLPEGGEVRGALDQLHDAIGVLFTSSITEYAKEEWEYSDSD